MIKHSLFKHYDLMKIFKFLRVKFTKFGQYMVLQKLTDSKLTWQAPKIPLLRDHVTLKKINISTFSNATILTDRTNVDSRKILGQLHVFLYKKTIFFCFLPEPQSS